MLSKVLANRLKSVLPYVVLESQNAFVVGMHITNSIVMTYEMNHYLKR